MENCKEYKVPGRNLKVFICEDYDSMSRKAGELVGAVLAAKPEAVMGLATGSSPVGLYRELIRMNREGKLDFAKIRSYNLDEYYPIQPDNEQSYHYFMAQNLFNHINIDKANVHVPDGRAGDVEEACRAYEAALNELGGVDVQVLGIGHNGHIGFNEPADVFPPVTHVVDLQESTIHANARFFEREEDVPRHAVTMGIGTIMRAKKIVLVANGTGKAEVLRAALTGPIDPRVPASILQVHPDVTFVLEKEAASLLP